MNDADRNHPSASDFSFCLATTLTLVAGIAAVVLYALWTQALAQCERCM